MFKILKIMLFMHNYLILGINVFVWPQKSHHLYFTKQIGRSPSLGNFDSDEYVSYVSIM